MELYYNPDALSEDRIKRTFVGRQWVLDELTTALRQQPEGAGVQHILIVAPRGMGKTTMFLMLGYAVEESDLKECWQVVRFREESYNITDAAEFWMEALRQLRDPELTPRMEQAIAEYRTSADLEAAAVALVKDWVRSHGKRLLLLVENFDEILAQINSEEENSRLRNVLMNDGSAMLIGAATSFFEEARGYEKPLYNFFKVFNLEALSQEQIQDLLIRRAELDGIAGFPEKLRQNAGQIRALAHFTGGNPRLVLMLYGVIVSAQLTEVRTGLEKLLDEVTPYFKARTERLSPQQRKILDQIARESARTMEGQSPTAIGKAIRLTPNQVSSQLKRMAEGGYVRAVNVRGRVAYYTLSEPLFALWYQMRFGRDARERMNWLVNFLRVWYDDAELGNETQKLCSRLAELISAGRREAVREALELGSYMVDAIRDRTTQNRALCDLVFGNIRVNQAEQACALLDSKLKPELTQAERVNILLLRCATNSSLRRHVEALTDFREAMSLCPGAWQDPGWRVQEAALLFQLGRLDAALDAANKALTLAPTDIDKMAIQRVRAKSLIGLRRWADAAEVSSEIRKTLPDDPEATFNLGVLEMASEGNPGSRENFLAVVRNTTEGDGNRLGALTGLFFISCSRGDYANAAADWRALSSEPLPEWKVPTLVDFLTGLAQSGHARFLLETVRVSPWAEPLAPFLRALEYVESGDRDLIERLSPEVRTVVEDIVARIKKQ